ncbi:hypothetical protein BaRGS_00024650, partial [Batillaria attramentaria]
MILVRSISVVTLSDVSASVRPAVLPVAKDFSTYFESNDRALQSFEVRIFSNDRAEFCFKLKLVWCIFLTCLLISTRTERIYKIQLGGFKVALVIKPCPSLNHRHTCRGIVLGSAPTSNDNVSGNAKRSSRHCV